MGNGSKIPILKLSSKDGQANDGWSQQPQQKFLSVANLKRKRGQPEQPQFNSAVISHPRRIGQTPFSLPFNSELDMECSEEQSTLTNKYKSKQLQKNPSLRVIPIKRVQDLDQLDVKSILKQIKQEQNSTKNRLQNLTDIHKKKALNDSSSSGTSEDEDDYGGVKSEKRKRHKTKKEEGEDAEDSDEAGGVTNRRQKHQIQFLDKAKLLRNDLNYVKEQSNTFVFVVRQLVQRVNQFLKYQMTVIEKNIANGVDYDPQ